MPQTEKMNYRYSEKEAIEQLENMFEKKLGAHDAKVNDIQTGRGAYYIKGVYETMNRKYLDTGVIDPRFEAMVNGIRYEN